MSFLQMTRRPPLWKPTTGTLINGGHPLVQRMVLCMLGLEKAGKILVNSRYPGVVDGSMATPAWTVGRFGMAFKSSAGSNDPTIASHPLLDGLFATGNPTTLIFWGFNIAGTLTLWTKFQSDQATVVWDANTNGTGLQLSLFSTNGGRFTPIGTYNGDGKWHQYAFVYDGIADWKTLSSYQFYQDGLPLVMSSSQNNPITERSDTGGNIQSGSTQPPWDHLLAWNGRALTASDIARLYVDPFCFMTLNQTSGGNVAAVSARKRKPFVFTVT